MGSFCYYRTVIIIVIAIVITALSLLAFLFLSTAPGEKENFTKTKIVH